MNAAEIAASLGGAHRSGTWWRCCCPVHNSRGSTLALRDGECGLIVHCHAGCDRADIIAALRGRGLLDGDNDRRRLELVKARRGCDSDDTAHRVALSWHIWNAAEDVRGSPVARYLARRGITLTPPRSMRWAPALRRPDGTSGPAMVARVDNIDGRLIGLHRTWLDRDAAGNWHRRNRASLGPIGGGAVRFAPAGETLMVAEGIETAMAAMTATAQPAWAALSTSGMVALILPPIVRHVIILADNDRSGAGERAARTAAARWLADGRRVQIALPPLPGTDFNDVLLGRAYAAVRHVAA